VSACRTASPSAFALTGDCRLRSFSSFGTTPVGGAAGLATPVVAPECDPAIVLQAARRSAPPDRADNDESLSKMPARMRGAAAGGLADDTRDLQRQMGCMAGIFQIFDRQRLITGAGRRAARQAQKRLPPPSTPPGNGGSAPRRAFAAPCISLLRYYVRLHLAQVFHKRP